MAKKNANKIIGLIRLAMRATAVFTSPSLIKIPSSPASPQTVGVSSTGRRRSDRLAIVASIVLVLLVALEMAATDDAAEDVRVWSLWIVTLVFPSQQVTWIKVLCLILGFVLTTSYFLSSQAQLASAERIMIQSATVLVSPLKKKHTGFGNERPATPLGTAAASWLASHYQSLLRMDHFATGDTGEQDEIPQLKIRDECKTSQDFPLPLSSSSGFMAVNSKHPIAFESEYLRGHVLFMVKDTMSTTADGSKQTGNWSSLFVNKRRTLWVQVQGQFKKLPPPQSVMYLATELPTPSGFQVAFLTRQLVSLLITLVKKLVPSAHIAFGDGASSKDDAELPHAAFPLFQTVDELVVTTPEDNGAVPSLGQECFGESSEAKARRSSTPVGKEPPLRPDAVYSFQFHTMYADLARWKIINVPGVPDMDLRRYCGDHPIRLAAYTVPVSNFDPAALCSLSHTQRDKHYLFCVSMHHNAKPANTSEGQRTEAMETEKEASLSPRPPASPNRWRSVSCDQPEPVVRQQSRGQEQHWSQLENPILTGRPQPRIRASSSVRNMTSLERAENLVNWKFSLPLWVERVDPAAGNRKVCYLFVVEDGKSQETGQARQQQRRCVVRSASTVKNTLLLLDTSDMSESTRVFKKLTTESREFLYETITRETEQVAHDLQAIAAIPSSEATELDKEKKAMLFNCLMSESALPCVRSYQDIAVQLTKAKRDQMDIIFEKGVYRMLNPRYMRQEWFALTTSEIHFFRSFTVKASKSIPLMQVLSARELDNVPFLEEHDVKPVDPDLKDASPRQGVREAAIRATNQWYGVEIQVLDEVLTFFVDSHADRSKCISSLNQLLKLKGSGGSSSSMGRLPSLRPIDALTASICCNARKHVPVSSNLYSLSRIQLSQEVVQHGLQLYRMAREEISAAQVVTFLDSVDQLTSLTWVDGGEADSVSGSDAERIVFALNVFHALFIHSWLLFGDVTAHSQWKKLKTYPTYSLGHCGQPQLRVSMSDMEAAILKAPVAPYDSAGSSKATRSIPRSMVPVAHDFRVVFALQTNAKKTTGCLIKVYDPAMLQDQLQETCAEFLEKELVVDVENRVICLPKQCDWMDQDLGINAPGVAAGSRAFFCLQKLLPLMATTQFDRVQHVLLGAGKECQIKYSPRFWTQETALLASSLPLQSDATRVIAYEPTQQAKDDSSLGMRLDVATGMPRSKSALQFIQSLFD